MADSRPTATGIHCVTLAQIRVKEVGAARVGGGSHREDPDVTPASYLFNQSRRRAPGDGNGAQNSTARTIQGLSHLPDEWLAEELHFPNLVNHKHPPAVPLGRRAHLGGEVFLLGSLLVGVRTYSGPL